MNAALRSATITSVTPQALLRACTRRGLPTRKIMDSAGLDAAGLVSAATRVPAPQVAALWQQARDAAGDDRIAIEAAEQLPIGGYRVFDYLLFSSHDGRQGLRHVVDTYPLLNEAFRFSLEQRQDAAHVTLARIDGEAHLPRLYVLFVFATLLVRLQHMVGFRHAVREVRLTARAQGSAADLEQWFGGRVRFGQPRNEIVAQTDLLAQPSLYGDPALCEILAEHARNLLGARPVPFDLAAAVRAEVAEILPLHEPALAPLAARLAISPRTLQRRLAEQGISFRTLVDDVRRERCRGLLQPGIPLEEVSSQLGFSEPSAFHRAFKRWMGLPPRQFLQ